MCLFGKQQTNKQTICKTTWSAIMFQHFILSAAQARQSIERARPDLTGNQSSNQVGLTCSVCSPMRLVNGPGRFHQSSERFVRDPLASRMSTSCLQTTRRNRTPLEAYSKSPEVLTDPCSTCIHSLRLLIESRAAATASPSIVPVRRGGGGLIELSPNVCRCRQTEETKRALSRFSNVV